MSLTNHLVELQRRHTALERELVELKAQPATDELRIAEMKRKKLQLKDEIVRLSKQEPPTIFH